MKRSVSEIADALMRLHTHTGGGHDDSLFAEDCTMRCKLFDLEGRAEIRKFHEESPRMDLAWRVFEYGNTAAVLYHARFKRMDGRWATADGIEWIEVNDKGEISRLVGFYDPEDWTQLSPNVQKASEQPPVRAAS